MLNAIPVKRHEALINKCKNIQPLAIGSNHFHLEFEPLTEALKEKAKTELRETPEIVDQGLAEIKKLIKEDAELMVPDDDYFLTKFLRPCKWYATSAFEMMKRYFNYRKDRPRFCTNLMPKNERAVFTSRVLTPLPLRAKDGSRIIVIQGGKLWNPKEVSVDQSFRGLMILIDTFLNEPATQISGYRLIIDMDGLSMSQIIHFTPPYAAAVIEWLQKCCPGRFKSTDIINQPYIFNILFAIFKPFIDAKYRKRLFFHGKNRDDLMSCYGSQALPKQYGGELEYSLGEPLEESLWDYLCNFNEEFQDLENMGYSKNK
ncbi:alpha-tocopherol transfer protein-like isoform X1 [Aphidius gifuensis]|uniref:alpha-tocopherol transfer protein-like isoform X1 n=1 Tax=Aphidius gifuensis TaxID=684658 RepID=UPI001CDD6D8F|nr:alpha-tocopherol transfer protein-like isoform X1 [Aphidius gifuensis]